ncbi:MAG: hypothetical protein K2X47_17190 [Bdellovibrionales bacterium]|nr:hypothetical protein [Bdellovibrionales bacterium]
MRYFLVALHFAFTFQSQGLLAAQGPTEVVWTAVASQSFTLENIDEIPLALQIPGQCLYASRDLVHLVRDYHKEAVRSDAADSVYAKNAKTIDQKIQSVLAGSGSCFDSLSRAYAAASVAFIEPISSPLLRLAVTYLNPKFERIDFLTLQKRNEMGCLWTKPGKLHTHQIYGAYMCRQRKILVDPTLPPINLGASVIHELDHLLRDAKSPLLDVDKLLRDWITYDEVMASALAAFLQARLDFSIPILRQANFRVFQSDIPLSNRKNFGYRLSFDKTLYAHEGPIKKIAEAYLRSRILDPYDFMMLSGLLPCSFRHASGSPNIDRLWLDVFNGVYKGYFSGSRDLGTSSQFLPFDPSSNYQTKTQCLNVAPILGLYHSQDLPGFMSLSADDLFFSTLRETETQLQSATFSCLMFERSAKSLESGIGDYAGVCKDPIRTGNEGVRTGNEGVRTTDSSARICRERTGI